MKKLITAGCVLTLCGLLALLGFYGYAYLSYVPLLGQDSRIRLYNNQGGLIYESTYQKNSEWINLEDVPQTMIDAVISIEDRRFYQHYGLDPVRIAKAVLVNNPTYYGICSDLKAIVKAAHAKGMKVIGLTGAKSSKLEQMSDICIKVPQIETYMIQELHLPVYHCLCLMLEERFFGENS